MKHTLLKWLSKYLPIKIPAGKSLSVSTAAGEPLQPPVAKTEKLIKVLKANDKSLDRRPLFFKPKADIGTLEYIGTNLETKMHVLQSLQRDEIYVVDTAALHGLFKGVIVTFTYQTPPEPSNNV